MLPAKPVVSDSDTHTFTVDGHTFYMSHAYSIQGVDPFNKTVNVVNPHDTSKPITLTYDQFLRTFADISAVNLNYNQMFRGGTRVQTRES